MLFKIQSAVDEASCPEFRARTFVKLLEKILTSILVLKYS